MKQQTTAQRLFLFLFAFTLGTLMLIWLRRQRSAVASTGHRFAITDTFAHAFADPERPEVRNSQQHRRAWLLVIPR